MSDVVSRTPDTKLTAEVVEMLRETSRVLAAAEMSCSDAALNYTARRLRAHADILNAFLASQ
jgi:hypothetical protein